MIVHQRRPMSRQSYQLPVLLLLLSVIFPCIVLAIPEVPHHPQISPNVGEESSDFYVVVLRGLDQEVDVESDGREECPMPSPSTGSGPVSSLKLQQPSGDLSPTYNHQEWMNHWHCRFDLKMHRFLAEWEQLYPSWKLHLHGRVGSLLGHYLLERSRKSEELSEVEDEELLENLAEHPMVESVHRQEPKLRLRKRTPTPQEFLYSSDGVFLPAASGAMQGWLRKRQRTPKEQWEDILNGLNIHDPGVSNQWHLFNKDQPGADINVTGLWNLNITGVNAYTAVIDDGVDMDHEDLKDNFVTFHE